METLQEQRAALKCAVARASAAVRSAHSTRKWQPVIQLMRKSARINPDNYPVTIDVCAASLPVCHFVSVTGRIAAVSALMNMKYLKKAVFKVIHREYDCIHGEP